MRLEQVGVLVNPAAGSGRGALVGTAVVSGLRSRGITVRELAADTAPESASLVAQTVSDGVDAVVVCGGDWTVNVAIAALAGTGTALGIIACGTGNDFARSLGLPRASVGAGLAVIAGGHRVAVDLGRAGDHWFGAVLASGFDSRVNDRGNRMRWPSGPVRYRLAMLAELAAFRPLEYHLRLDEEELTLPAMLVAVGNGPSYGGGMKICPGASLFDGLLDITVVSKMSRTHLLRLFPSVYSGRHVRYPQVLTFRAASVSLHAEGVTAYADGDPVGALPVTCTAMPAALHVLVAGPGAAGAGVAGGSRPE